MRSGAYPRPGTRMRVYVGLCAVLVLAFFVLWTGVALAASASVFYGGPKDRKQIALTFDDNSSTAHGLATLHVLEKYKVHATLFVIGDAVTRYPSLSREIAAGVGDGLFEVGDHTWSHPELTKMSAATIAGQIGGGTAAFRTFTGVRTVPLLASRNTWGVARLRGWGRPSGCVGLPQ